jgi:type IV pilus assembly protein PilA
MKRIRKSKIGFTLLEMVIVVAIIAILAGVITISIGTFISNSKARSISADEARSSAVVNIQSSEARMSELGFNNLVSTSAT